MFNLPLPAATASSGEEERGASERSEKEDLQTQGSQNWLVRLETWGYPDTVAQIKLVPFECIFS